MIMLMTHAHARTHPHSAVVQSCAPHNSCATGIRLPLKVRTPSDLSRHQKPRPPQHENFCPIFQLLHLFPPPSSTFFLLSALSASMQRFSRVWWRFFYIVCLRGQASDGARLAPEMCPPKPPREAEAVAAARRKTQETRTAGAGERSRSERRATSCPLYQENMLFSYVDVVLHAHTPL